MTHWKVRNFPWKMLDITAQKCYNEYEKSGRKTAQTRKACIMKKNTMNTPDKLSLRKYDPVLRKHVLFVETKKNLGRNEVKEKKR